MGPGVARGCVPVYGGGVRLVDGEVAREEEGWAGDQDPSLSSLLGHRMAVGHLRSLNLLFLL